MKTIRSYFLAAAFLLNLLVSASYGATSLASIYFDSYNSLQQNLQSAVAVYRAPELGFLSALIGTHLPGFFEMDNDKPMAIHILDIGEGAVAAVLDVEASTSAEAYLHALSAAGQQFPEATDGFYRFSKRLAARPYGKRVLLSMDGNRPERWFGGNLGAMPSIPEIPGFLRISVYPASISAMLKQMVEQLDKRNHDLTETAKQSLKEILGAYSSLLEQIDGAYLGIAIEDSNLCLRSSVIAQKNSDLEALYGTMKTVGNVQKNFFDPDAILNLAAGKSTLPAGLREVIINLYGGVIRMQGTGFDVSVDDLMELLNHSMDNEIGAALSLSMTSPKDSKDIHAKSLLQVERPEEYLAEKIAFAKTEIYRKIVNAEFTEPAQRQYKDHTILSFANKIDTTQQKLKIREALGAGMKAPIAAERLAQMEKIFDILTSLIAGNNDMAATSRGVVSGIGSPQMAEQAIDIVLGNKKSPYATRLTEMLTAVGATDGMYALGSFNTGGLLDLVDRLSDAEPTQRTTENSTIAFGQWTFYSELQGVVIVPKAVVDLLRQLNRP